MDRANKKGRDVEVWVETRDEASRDGVVNWPTTAGTNNTPAAIAMTAFFVVDFKK